MITPLPEQLLVYQSITFPEGHHLQKHAYIPLNCATTAYHIVCLAPVVCALWRIRMGLTLWKLRSTWSPLALCRENMLPVAHLKGVATLVSL